MNRYYALTAAALALGVQCSLSGCAFWKGGTPAPDLPPSTTGTISATYTLPNRGGWRCSDAEFEFVLTPGKLTGTDGISTTLRSGLTGLALTGDDCVARYSATKLSPGEWTVSFANSCQQVTLMAGEWKAANLRSMEFSC